MLLDGWLIKNHLLLIVLNSNYLYKEIHISRRIILNNPNHYRGYALNSKYSYDKMQLDKIIDSLEYYRNIAIQENHKYVVFSFCIFTKKNEPVFDVKDLKTIFSSKHFFYRWTREYKDQYNTGEHYHVMVIANNTNNTRCFDLKDEIEKLKGVNRCFFAPRKGQGKNSFFHNLSFELGDALHRFCYYSKIDQKQNIINRSFDGSRILKPLHPIKQYDSNEWRKTQMFNQNNEIFISQNKESVYPIQNNYQNNLKVNF